MDLREYLSVFRRRRWLVLLSVTVVVASALIVSFLQTPVYRASARLLIQHDQSVFGADPGQANSPFVYTQTQVMESPPVRELVESKLGSRPPVSVAVVGTTPVVQISAESERPEEAAAIVSAYVDAYLTHRVRQATDALGAASRELQSKIDSLQKEIDALSAQLAATPSCTETSPSGACARGETLQRDRDALVTQQVPFKQKLAELQVNSSVGNPGTQIVTPATVPEAPVRPTPIRNGLVALGLGLVFGTAVAFLFEHLDDSIKSKDDFERSARDIAVLALIPSVAGWKDRDSSRLVSHYEPASPSAEAYRTLRTSIRFLAVDRPLRTIQVTSPRAGEGKTTTTANLGVVLARAGERVVVVSCDLRRPRLHDFFGLSNNVGFTSVLLGEAPLSSALQRVNPDDDRLWLLASGPLPPNPSELLSSARASEVLSGLIGFADTVLIDSPPVLPVTDATVLSAKVDGTLLVVAAGATTGKQVVRSVEVLRQVGATLVGAVLNNAPAESAYDYTYGYYTAEQRGKRSRVEALTVRGNGKAPEGTSTKTQTSR